MSAHHDSTKRPCWGCRPQFTPEQIDSYISHLGLDPEDVWRQSKGYNLLSLLHNRHCLSVPFETTAIHVQDNSHSSSESTVELGFGPGISLDLNALHHRIVIQKRGSYCFGLNVAFSALLRGVGFTSIAEV